MRGDSFARIGPLRRLVSRVRLSTRRALISGGHFAAEVQAFEASGAGQTMNSDIDIEVIRMELQTSELLYGPWR